MAEQPFNCGPLVTIVGSANVDFIMRVPRLPAVGETVTDGTFKQVFGGKGANSAVAAARAAGGRGSVHFVARVGDDAFGPSMRRDFADSGLDIEHVTIDSDTPSGSALVMFDVHGDNYLTVAPGANDRLTPAHVDAAADRIRASRVVLLQMEIPPDTVAAAISAARGGGASVVVNYAPVRGMEVSVDGSIDTLIVNETEAAQLAGREASPEELAADLLGRGPSLVIVTLGAKGVLLADASGVRRQAGFEVEPVDATAAGDTFCGAFCVARAEGTGVDNAARFAQAAAALCVTGFGAQPSIPARQTILAFLSKQ